MKIKDYLILGLISVIVVILLFGKSCSTVKNTPEQIVTRTVDTITKIETNDQNEFMFIKSDSKLIQIRLKEILWIEALGNYMRVHTEKEKHTILSTMKDIVAKLPNKDFVRVQRSFIVRFDKIQSIEDNYVVMLDKEIHIGKAYKDEFNKRVNLL